MLSTGKIVNNRNKMKENKCNDSSRDVLMHVSEKDILLNNFYTWLKEDGRVLITDFCCGQTPFSQDLIDYARSGMYTLTSIQEYTEV